VLEQVLNVLFDFRNLAIVDNQALDEKISMVFLINIQLDILKLHFYLI